MSDHCTNKPLAKAYRNAVEQDQIQTDSAQLQVVDYFDKIYQQLKDSPRRWYQRRWRAVQGLYLWGGVGRGKTWLMDLFYKNLPLEAKRRVHFHDFMQSVHQALKKHKNKQDPLTYVARDWSQDRVLCFDEFFVTDIADAMILSRLMQALFKEHITLIATSNIAPDHLYYGGLQRQRFLPAIERLKKNCRIIRMPDGMDFRMGLHEHEKTYHSPCSSQAEAALKQQFKAWSGSKPKPNSIELYGRNIKTLGQGKRTIWFEFDALCRGPRAAADYSALAQRFTAVFVSNIPQLPSSQDEATRRFITLIDVLYDHHCQLFCSAQAPIEHLYQGHHLAFAFKRTISRLNEMASKSYTQQAAQRA